MSGVVDASDCFFLDNPEDFFLVNHAVLMVGYGTDTATGLDYWLIRNSWNITWGDQGYIKIKIDADDTYDNHGICGVNFMIVYPILRWNGPY